MTQLAKFLFSLASFLMDGRPASCGTHQGFIQSVALGSPLSQHVKISYSDSSKNKQACVVLHVNVENHSGEEGGGGGGAKLYHGEVRKGGMSCLAYLSRGEQESRGCPLHSPIYM